MAELRQSLITGDDEIALEGVAAVYGVVHWAESLGRTGRRGSSWQMLAPGCFGKSLAAKRPIRLLVDHDKAQCLSTSLTFKDDQQRLSYSCPLHADQRGAKAAEIVSEGYRETSVGFNPQAFSVQMIRGRPVHVITRAELVEISLSTKGAIPGTDARIRSASRKPLSQAMQSFNLAVRRTNCRPSSTANAPLQVIYYTSDVSGAVLRSSSPIQRVV